MLTGGWVGFTVNRLVKNQDLLFKKLDLMRENVVTTGMCDRTLSSHKAFVQVQVDGLEKRVEHLEA